MDDGRIASVAAVPEDSTFLFRVRDGDDEMKEAILVRTDNGDDKDDGDREGSVAAWLNYCQHFTHIELDKGSGATMRGDEIVCENHGAYFEGDTGFCTYGPCEGAYLRSVAVTVEDGDVYLADGDFEFAGVGPIPTDDLDLASESNVEF